MRGGDAEIAAQRELEATSERSPVDCGHDGLGTVIERSELAAVESDLHAHVVLAHPLPFLEVGPGAEGFLACTGDDDGANGWVGRRLAGQLSERKQRGARKGVGPVSALDGPDEDAATLVDADGEVLAHFFDPFLSLPAERTLLGPPPWLWLASSLARRVFMS